MTKQEKWQCWYNQQQNEDYFKQILKREEQLDHQMILSPFKEDRLRVFDFKDISKIHTVLIGSRPYYEASAADGYAFSSLGDPSLEMNYLYEKIYNELGVVCNKENHSKERWANQGILLLNLELTTKSGSKKDETSLWRPFTIKFLRYLIEDNQRRAFIFLDRYSSKTPQLFYDKKERDHLYIQCNIRTPAFKQVPIFKPLNEFIEYNYNLRVDWH